MRILITNNTLASRAGSELYVRDLAIALMKRGHQPVAYSTLLGDVAEELRRATVPVIEDLHALSMPPDIIHGQHHLDAVTAMLHFPGVPAVYTCHGWLPWEEIPPVLPGIRRHVAVDDLCHERLITTTGIDPRHTEVIYNFADLQRFPLRPSLPDEPRSALIFSNYANGEASIAPIRSACLKAGIEKVDVVGSGMGSASADPGRILGNYDLVFAKARAAIEALVSGCAVIVADQAGLASMVTTNDMAELRRLNFGVRTMQRSRLTEEAVIQEIQRYDAEDARQVSLRMRHEANLEQAVDRWLQVYSEVLTEKGDMESPGFLQKQMRAGSAYLRWLSPIIKGRNQFEAESQAYSQHLEQLNSQLEKQNLEQSKVLTEHMARVQQLEQTEAMFFQRNRERDEQLTLLKAQLDAIQASRTWRLLAPYRNARQWLRQK